MSITSEDMELLKAKFVSKDDCNAIQAEHTEKLAKETVRASVMETQLATIIKLLWIIAGAYIGGVIAAILALIMR